MITKFIATNLPEPLEIPGKIEMETTCAMCGDKVSEAYKKKSVLSSVWTDFEYIRYPSDYICTNCTLCIKPCIKTEKRPNALRSYSYIVSEKGLQILKREALLQYIIEPPNPPFAFCVTYSNKKHTSFKAVVNASRERFTVRTDVDSVEICRDEALDFLKLAQPWYTVIPGKEGNAQQPTYFSKGDIMNGCTNMKRIMDYGVDKYQKETQKIEKYRGTGFIKLTTFMLNKELKDVEN